MFYNKPEKRNQSHKVSALQIKGKKTFEKQNIHFGIQKLYCFEILLF